MISRQRDRLRPTVQILLAVCFGMSASACLIPQDNAVLPNLPPKRNSPLRIVAQRPEQRESSETCPKTEFSVQVTDEDLAFEMESPDGGRVRKPGLSREAISAQWYIDPPPDYSEKAVAGGTKEGGLSATVELAVSFGDNDFQDGKQHVVEVWVKDSAFQIGPPNQTAPEVRDLPDGTSVQDTPSVDSYLWLIRGTKCQ